MSRRFVAVALILVAVGFVGRVIGNSPPLVRGTLRFEGGIQGPGPPRPHWEAEVQLTFVPKQAGTPKVVITDALGRFSLRIRPGQYKAVIEGPGAKAFENGKPMQPQAYVMVNGVPIQAPPTNTITV